ncbi:RloB family protein [Myceligenerans cantabricum]
MGRKTSLRRSAETRTERRTILVLTEGDTTEPAYIKALKRLERVRRRTSITIASEHVVPYPLVEKAIQYAGDAEIDDVWCLFDVESPQPHPRLREAVHLAAAHDKVHIALSNPCFEIWLLLHVEDVNGYLSTDAACRRANELSSVSGKHVDAESLLPLRAEAAARARKLEQRHERDGSSFPHDNPSTSIYRFIEMAEDGGTGGRASG